VIVAVAVVPQPPLLVPELAGGAAGETAGLRGACLAAVARFAERGARHWCAIGSRPGDPQRVSPATVGTFGGYGVDVPIRLAPESGPFSADPSRPDQVAPADPFTRPGTPDPRGHGRPAATGPGRDPALPADPGDPAVPGGPAPSGGPSVSGGPARAWQPAGFAGPEQGVMRPPAGPADPTRPDAPAGRSPDGRAAGHALADPAATHRPAVAGPTGMVGSGAATGAWGPPPAPRRDPPIGVDPWPSAAELPLPMLVAGWLRGQVDPDRAVVHGRLVDPATPVADCRRLGAAVAAEIGPTDLAWGLLVLGDGSGPVYPLGGPAEQHRRRVDTAAREALAYADAGALLELDPDLGRELAVSGRAPWQVLAGAARATRIPWRAELLHSSAPYGVTYHVAVWEPAR
jgi:hypothetical protein